MANSMTPQEAASFLREWADDFKSKLDILCKKLAEMGATKVSLGYARAIYSGDTKNKDIKVDVVRVSGGYQIVANGKSVLFVEFGTGITYGYGHPEAGKFGMGPGTYPDGKGHWNDPKGWWLPESVGGGHTYGNPPNPVMYRTAKELREAILEVAKEVFKS